MMSVHPERVDVLRATDPGIPAGSKRERKAELKMRAYSCDVTTESTAQECQACRKQTGRALSEGLCVKCFAKIAKARVFARSHGGRAEVGSDERSVAFTCRRDHQWAVQFAKVGRSWCATC